MGVPLPAWRPRLEAGAARRVPVGAGRGGGVGAGAGAAAAGAAMLRHSSRTRLVNDSMEPLRQGWPGGMKCRPTRSPAQSAIAAQASSGPCGRRREGWRCRGRTGGGSRGFRLYSRASAEISVQSPCVEGEAGSGETSQVRRMPPFRVKPYPAPPFSTEAVHRPARVNVTCVTPLGEEAASTS